MQKNNFFPAGLALGQAFCNRVKERVVLQKCVQKNEHVVLVSPRRYGKTSLITQVIQENDVPHCSIDFLPATNSQFVKNAILNGVGELLPFILPKQKVLMKKLLTFFKGLNPKLSVSLVKVGFSIEFASTQPPAKSITEVLLGLDQVAQKTDQRAVVLMDEFQQLSFISDSHTLEASIRHAVERSQNITYIFSGSDRHTLEQMFQDKNRPLYHLCKLIRIERIHSEDFKSFLQNAAKIRWDASLSSEAIETILELTQCHTFYVNYLCRQLWNFDTIPQKETVERAWELYVQEQLPWITDDIGRLSANQRIILFVLVREPTNEIFSQYFLEKTGLQMSSIRRAIDTLQKSNMVGKSEKGVYYVLDPAIASYLRTVKSLF